MAPTQITLTGAVRASLAAGPLFLLGLGLGTLVCDPAAPHAILINEEIVTGLVIGAVPTILAGVVLSIVPNIVGMVAMILLGDHNQGTRLPAMWALAGAAACAIPYWAVGATRPEFLVAFTFTGTCCALICRRWIEWGSENSAPLPNPRAPAICTRHDS